MFKLLFITHAVIKSNVRSVKIGSGSENKNESKYDVNLASKN